MIVVTKNRTGWDGLGGQYPRSRTAIYPNAGSTVHTAQQASGGWVSVNRLNGLGAGMNVPTWIWWGLGGLAVGGIAGYFLLKK